MTASTIIDESFLPRIRKALVDLDTLDRELELAGRAGLHLGPGGVDIVQMQKEAASARAIFQQILNVYFPGQ